jgi:hypothetical protein
MTSPPVRTRSFVMVLAGWMALASATVVALSTPGTAAFAVLGVGLVAVTTLFLSLRWGIGVAAGSLVVFALAAAAGPVPPWSLGTDELGLLLRSLVRWQTLLPDLMAAVALGGTAACAELASAGLEWDQVLRGAVGTRRPTEDIEPVRPRPERDRGYGTGARPHRRAQATRNTEEA